jgi:hypothetical protein
MQLFSFQRMVLESLWGWLSPFWVEFNQHWQTTTIFTLAIALYTLLVWHYFHLVAKRDLLKFNKIKGDGFWVTIGNLMGEFVFVLEYLIVFPIITFIFFGVFALAMLFLAKEQSIEAILLISITVISATRVMAYYNEAASQELAKLIPIVLLGAYLTTPSFFSLELVLSRVQELPSFVNRIGGFILFTMVLEISLKIMLNIKVGLMGENSSTAGKK